MVPLFLQLIGVALVGLFLWLVWPPLAALGAGVFFLAFGLSLERNMVKPNGGTAESV